MIIDNKSLSMAEVLEYTKGKDSEADIVGFIEKFTKFTTKEAKEIRSKLEGFEMMKMKPEHISKIIDLVPESQEDLNKIFMGVNLDEDESKKILETVKEFK
jgi:DNA-directed RNA polymerase subunit F